MLRSTPRVIFVSLLVGVAAGAALGYWEARPWSATNVSTVPATSDLAAAQQASVAKSEPAAPVKGPAAVVPELVYRFGNMEMNTTKNHVFPIKNVGDAPLTVTFLSHTCKCTKVMLDGKEVEPDDFVEVPAGGQTQVELEWAAKVAPGPFRHGADFKTSDPNASRLEIKVEGEIVGTDTVSPGQLLFGSIRAGEKGTAQVFVMSFIDKNVEVKSATVVEPELAKNLKVRIEPATKAELPDKNALSGVRLVADYDAASVIGLFGGSVRLETNLPKSPTLVIPVIGTVKGDISLFGHGWSDTLGMVRMDPIKSSAGGKSSLNITIRGDHVAETKLEVASVTPKELKAKLGERRELGPKLAQQSIEFEIPAGTRPMSRAGEEQGGEGMVVLKTGHPITPEVRIRVQFTVSP